MIITKSEWNGYEQLNFQVGGRDSYVVCPKTPAPGNPWVWRTEFFGAFDSVDRELLDRGWFLAYHGMAELYGAPVAMDYMVEFQAAVEKELGLSHSPALFGFSRGGCYCINYAWAHPENVGALYLDAPYCNFTAQPGHFGTEMMDHLLAAYGLTEQELWEFKGMPLHHAAEIGAHNVPIVCCVGLEDRAVYYDKNFKVFAEDYKAAGGNKLLVFEKPGCGHHPHSFSDPEHVKAIADFLEQHCCK